MQARSSPPNPADPNNEPDLPDLSKVRGSAASTLGKFASSEFSLIIAILTIAGILLLIAANNLHGSSFWHHMLRDAGIAILISAIITLVYEKYARLHFESMLMNSFLGVVIADWSRHDIWKALKSQVIEKTVVRENLRLAIGLQRDKRLPPGQMLLKLQASYRLLGLRSQSVNANIEHFLDWHFKIKGHDLPCFGKIKVGNHEIPVDSKSFNDKGEFTYAVRVPAKDSGVIPVSTSRQEVIYFPGTHGFVLNEITKGVEVLLNTIPDDIAVFVTIRPHTDLKYRELKTESPDDHIKIDDIVLFPGQIIELLFQPKDLPPLQSKTV